MAIERGWEADVALADGGTVRIRPVDRADGDGLRRLYERLSDQSRYLRFFSYYPAALADDTERLDEVDFVSRVTIVAELDDEIVASARYDRDAAGDAAEVAFVVDDAQQGRGIGTALLEHLAAIGREMGIARFVASTLVDNVAMQHVFRDAGYEIARERSAGVVNFEFPIRATPRSLEVQLDREHHAEARSVGRLLAPRSIAVVGASRRAGTIGHEVFRNLLDGDFNGPVYPVNRTATHVAGVRAYPRLSEVPDDVDLVIVAVPAPEVPAAVEECAVKRAHGVVVISAGFAEIGGPGIATERELVEIVRRHGMRMIGPNCMGVVNTNRDVRMNATFAPVAPRPGRVAFSSQSGALGIELLSRAEELGLGISTFVSIGNKADVSGNDLLQYWEQDADTDVILLYLESFGNPQKFARLARRVSHAKPIVAVKSGRTLAGTRAASSHTAALASPEDAVDALFHQAGVIRVETLEQLFDTAQLLTHQPLPSGGRVAIVSNGGGPAILAADACAAAGLEVPELVSEVQAELRTFVDAGASVRNPIDLVASASAAVYERALRTVLEADDVDALLVVFVPPLVTRAEDVASAIIRAADAGRGKTIVACFLGHHGVSDALQPSRSDQRPIPSYAFPESAVAALGRAARYARWLERSEGTVPTFAIDLDRARALVARQLETSPAGAWLDPEVANDLCTCFGIPVAASEHVTTADEAAAAAEAMGFPVAVKVGSGAVVHKTEVGGVHLGVESPEEVRAAFTTMAASFGSTMGGAVVQPMVEPGVETIVGITHDSSFGALVMLGMGGTAAELLRDTTLRILPVTDVDAHEMVRALRTSPLLFGYRGEPAADVPALERLLLRVARLADEIPEIAEMDCNPVIVSPGGTTVVDVKIRIAPVPPPPLPGVRRLRDVTDAGRGHRA